MLHYQKLFQRMVEGVLVIKKGREKSLIEIVLDIISKPKKRQQTLRVPMQTSNCLFVNKLTTITYMFPSNLINHIAVLQKNTKKCQKIIKFLSMSKNTKKITKMLLG